MTRKARALTTSLEDYLETICRLVEEKRVRWRLVPWVF
ncbi:hypothetical protein ES703_89160 [subsurface metagenome]